MPTASTISTTLPPRPPRLRTTGRPPTPRCYPPTMSALPRYVRWHRERYSRVNRGTRVRHADSKDSLCRFVGTPQRNRARRGTLEQRPCHITGLRCRGEPGVPWCDKGFRGSREPRITLRVGKLTPGDGSAPVSAVPKLSLFQGGSHRAQGAHRQPRRNRCPRCPRLPGRRDRERRRLRRSGPGRVCTSARPTRHSRWAVTPRPPATWTWPRCCRPPPIRAPTPSTPATASSPRTPTSRRPSSTPA